TIGVIQIFRESVIHLQTEVLIKAALRFDDQRVVFCTSITVPDDSDVLKLRKRTQQLRLSDGSRKAQLVGCSNAEERIVCLRRQSRALALQRGGQSVDVVSSGRRGAVE